MIEMEISRFAFEEVLGFYPSFPFLLSIKLIIFQTF